LFARRAQSTTEAEEARQEDAQKSLKEKRAEKRKAATPGYGLDT
jgi:hypothetical protein